MVAGHPPFLCQRGHVLKTHLFSNSGQRLPKQNEHEKDFVTNRFIPVLTHGFQHSESLGPKLCRDSLYITHLASSLQRCRAYGHTPPIRSPNTLEKCTRSQISLCKTSCFRAILSFSFLFRVISASDLRLKSTYVLCFNTLRV